MGLRFGRRLAAILAAALVAGCGTNMPVGPTPTPTTVATASPAAATSPSLVGSPSASPARSPGPTATLPPTLATFTILPQRPEIGALAFTDAGHGWIGGSGTILGTTDGGRTWHQQWSGARTVTALTVFDRRHAFALAGPVAPDGTVTPDRILRTADAGSNWVAIRLAAPVTSPVFVSPTVGWAIGVPTLGPDTTGIPAAPGPLVHTVDGGRTWTRAGVGDVGAVCFADAAHGWAVGRSTLRTTDGGRAWHAVSKVPGAAISSALALGCRGGTLWLFQDRGGGAGGHVNYAGFTSTDGGRHWIQVLGNGFYPGTPSGVGQAGDEPGPFVAPDGSTAVELGSSPAAERLLITVTHDRGRTWQTTTIAGLGSEPGGIAFPDSRHGFVLGSADGFETVVLATDDGGRTWSERWRTLAPDPLGAIAFVSASLGFGVGLPGDARAILQTTDGGLSWSRLAEMPEAADTFRVDPNRFSFADAVHGWVVSTVGHLLATADGGQTWRVLTLPAGTAEVAQAALGDASHGCAVTNPGDAAALFSTSDGGATWEPVADATEPVAVCAHGDAGRAVAAAEAAYGDTGPARLSFLGGRTAWALLDAGLAWTADGGATWDGVTWPTPVRPGGETAFTGPFEVSFATATDGWMLANDGSILRTNDGGRSWSQLPTSREPATACTSAQVTVSAVDSGGGLGTVGGWLRFLNASRAPCSLRGWPTLVGVTATGATTAARHEDALLTFPDIDGMPTVTLDPGDAAFAAYAGGDTPAGSAATCPPSYRTLRVAPPGATRSVSVSAHNAWLGDDLPACVGIAVTFVVPASTVPWLLPLRS